MYFRYVKVKPNAGYRVKIGVATHTTIHVFVGHT
jgi:hypothetical protein